MISMGQVAGPMTKNMGSERTHPSILLEYSPYGQ